MGKWVRIINFKDCSLSLITDFTEEVELLIIEFVIKDQFIKDFTTTKSS